MDEKRRVRVTGSRVRRLLPDASVRLPSLVGAVLLAPAVAAANGTIGSGCPAYPAHLHAARNALVRGDRRAAAAELRSAEAALETCLRREGGGETVFAARDPRAR
jgi:hypothetical protein